jgi:hypothetical protein
VGNAIARALTLAPQGPYYNKHRRGLPCVKETDPFREDYFARKRRNRQAWRLSLFTMFLVYPYVSSTILRMHVCKDVEGVKYLLADFTLQCYTDRWHRYLPYNVFAIFVYPVGIPALFLALLLRHRYEFNRPDIRAQIGFLYDGFAANCWWFELLDMLVKLTLVSRPRARRSRSPVPPLTVGPPARARRLHWSGSSRSRRSCRSRWRSL